MPTRSRFLTVIISLLFFSSSFANIINVPSPGNNNDIQPKLQELADSAFSGDILVLPAGTFILNKSVVIRRFISIKGQGMSSTILYRSSSTPDNTLSNDPDWSGMFRFEINSSASSNITISDMYLKSKQPSVVDGDGLSRAADIGIKMLRCVDFVITRCRFDYFGNGAVSVYHDDVLARGLIFKNEFHHNVKGADGLGLGYGVVIYGTNQQWVSNPQFGSSNFIFVEDNLFDYHRHSIAAGGGGLYVFRYNTVNNNVAANTSHAIDAHSANLSGFENFYSTRAIEVYNNRIINTWFKDDSPAHAHANGMPIEPGHSVSWLVEACIRPRGGEALVHHNYIKGFRFGVGPIAEGTLDSQYPDRYQVGYLSGTQYGSSHTGTYQSRGEGDLFIWVDTFDLYDINSSDNVYFYNYSPNNIVWERDYHVYSKAGYTPYTYPHPLRSIAPPPPGGSPAILEPENLQKKLNSFDVRPNPNNGVFSLDFNVTNTDNYILTVSDASGKVVQQKKLSAFKGAYSTSINLSNQGKGVYFVSLAGGGSTKTKKILVH